MDFLFVYFVSQCIHALNHPIIEPSRYMSMHTCSASACVHGLLVCVLCQPVHSCIEPSLHEVDFFGDLFLSFFDLNLISSHISSKLLALNPAKCKCIDSYPSLYLGVLLTPNLSWSPHILKVRQKDRKVLGIIYRHFYKFSTPATILRLYISLVWPILEYCAPVWSPSSTSFTHSLESVESFALKIASKFGQILLPTTSLNFTPLCLSSAFLTTPYI